MATYDQRLANPRERIYLPEALKEASKQKTLEEKVAVLRKFANRNKESLDLMKNFMQCIYHPAVVIDLPEGDPPYKNDYLDYNLAPSSLIHCFKKIKYFVKGHSNYIQNQIKRESVFIQMLESVYKDESRLLIMIKDKKIDGRVYKGLNEDVFRAAFSGWLPPKENPTKED